jgi:hypothetical protein
MYKQKAAEKWFVAVSQVLKHRRPLVIDPIFWCVAASHGLVWEILILFFLAAIVMSV